VEVGSVAGIEHLYVDQFGAFVGKTSERIIVTLKGERLAQAPLVYLQTITIASQGVGFSSDVVSLCSERGIPIFFVDSIGSPIASLYADGLNATIVTRREQLRAYDDARGVHVGCAIAAGKIENQSVTLRYFAKNRQNTSAGEVLLHASDAVRDALTLVESIRGAAHIDQARQTILTAEGMAGRAYWEAVRAIVPEGYAWASRETRGAVDPINSLLNYGYGVLRSHIERALMYAGLDPFGGFIHADRPGKPSLTLDLIEEFRQVCVDRLVIGLVNRQLHVEQDEQGMLSAETRRVLVEHLLTHLKSAVRYNGQKHILGHVIQMQARALAAYLRGSRPAYTPFRASW
jgi:CRISPR-associated protein Cas1